MKNAEPAARVEQPTPRYCPPTCYEGLHPGQLCLKPPAAPVVEQREIELIPTSYGTFRVVVGEIYACAELAEAQKKYAELVAQRTDGEGQPK